MTKRYFGTDGIRGQANAFPMTPEIALKVGMAVGLHYHNGHRQRVVIGKDTRLSGYLIENALTAGFLAGARAALETCRAESIERAYLKERSPSCGVRHTHVQGELVEGPGLTAGLLQRNGIVTDAC